MSKRNAQFIRAALVEMVLALPAFAGAGEKLLVFAGAASKPPAEEAARLYEQKTGVRVALVFGGSGYVLFQMKLARRGDLYFPGSSDYMEKAKREGDVLPETERIVVYLVPGSTCQRAIPAAFDRCGTSRDRA